MSPTIDLKAPIQLRPCYHRRVCQHPSPIRFQRWTTTRSQPTLGCQHQNPETSGTGVTQEDTRSCRWPKWTAAVDGSRHARAPYTRLGTGTGPGGPRGPLKGPRWPPRICIIIGEVEA
ncbi:hypothetical protein JTE90_003819 [Oedothorax gibbosus]|uniref:Uncharacterized protein n=1 Tax=Oedothorax gibbosus TaxID=931172 RepID=A0AAV6VGC5_9ARAC|nr:hypothetical protein JTE90_003819 [Oedothorax gibbosus]